MIPDRTNELKKAIMGELTDELASLPERIEAKSYRSEIVIIFNDIPFPNAMLGGITRADNYNW